MKQAFYFFSFICFMLGSLGMDAQTMTLPKNPNGGGGGIHFVSSPCIDLNEDENISLSLTLNNDFLFPTNIISIAGDATTQNTSETDFTADVTDTPNSTILPGESNTFYLNLPSDELYGQTISGVSGVWVIIQFKIEYTYHGQLLSWYRAIAFSACGRTGGGVPFTGRREGKFDHNNLVDDVKVKPNPAKENITIEYNVIEDSNVKIEIFNELGQVVKKVTSSKKSIGLQEENISLDGLDAGIYYIKLVTDKERIVKRFIKI